MDKKKPAGGGHPHAGRRFASDARHFTPRLDARTVKAGIDPTGFYRAEVPTMPAPKRGGWVDGGLCPFHDDRSRGNFRVHTETGAYVCFACGAKGSDVVAFTQARHGLSFREALEWLGGAYA